MLVAASVASSVIFFITIPASEFVDPSFEDERQMYTRERGNMKLVRKVQTPSRRGETLVGAGMMFATSQQTFHNDTLKIPIVSELKQNRTPATLCRISRISVFPYPAEIPTKSLVQFYRPHNLNLVFEALRSCFSHTRNCLKIPMILKIAFTVGFV